MYVGGCSDKVTVMLAHTQHKKRHKHPHIHVVQDCMRVQYDLQRVVTEGVNADHEGGSD